MLRADLVLATFMLSAVQAYADPLLEAVSFATTGSDAAKVTVIDRQKCIFRVEEKTYFLNNIQTNRINFQNMRSMARGNYTNIDIHGKQKVVDIYEKGITYDGSEFHQELTKSAPALFKPSTSSVADYTISITTNESKRLIAAWQYIYANGCAGQPSAF